MTTNEQDRLVRKAVRARSLVDPLGAMGYRTTSTRVDREARWRRAAFAATGACFAGVLSSILIGSGPGALLASQLPDDVVVSQLAGSTTNGQLAPSVQPALVYLEDDEGEYEADDAHVGSSQVPAPEVVVTAPQQQTQPSHGSTGGS